MTRISLAVLLVALALPTTASAEVTRSVTAIGSAMATVTPAAQTDASIKAGIADAQAAAGPRAVAAAKAEAQRLATAAGLTLGALVSVTEQPQSPYFGPFPYGIDGTFGPGKWCGTIRTPILKKVKGGGRRRTGRYRTAHGCRFPHQVQTNVSATFAAT